MAALGDQSAGAQDEQGRPRAREAGARRDQDERASVGGSPPAEPS